MPSPLTIVFDSTSRSKDPDGRLHIAVSHISKATVNPYWGNEIPGWARLGLDPEKTYRMLRDPNELAKGAHTFARLQIMGKHIVVSAADPHKDNIVGSIGSNVVFNDPYLDADLCFWDAEAIEDIETNSVRELSCAYRYTPVMVPGVWQGQEYDGVMTEIIGNHLALVEAGRAGSDCLAADEDIDGFSESDHPRSNNGQFGAGSLPETGGPKLKGKALAESMQRMKAAEIRGLERTLEGLKGEKGSKARAREAHVTRELEYRKSANDSDFLQRFGGDSRPIAVADEDITMKMTKLGKALFFTLGGMSPKLAADNAFAGLVSKASRKNPVDATKIIALDSALDPDKVAKTLAAVMALDAEKEEKEEKEEKGKGECGAEDEDDEEAEDEDDEEAERKAKEAKDKAKDEEKAKDAEKAMDAKIATMRQGYRDADEAKRLVRPVVGDVVTQDSAEEIYGFALDQAKVNRDGVTGVPALKALFVAANAARTSTPAVAMDHATAATMFPNASRFSHQ
jgi:hypothetical protein